MSPSGDGLLADLFLGRPRSRRYPKFNIRRDIPSTFLKAHWGAIAATDLFTVEVVNPFGLVRYHVLFVIDIAIRCVCIGGITSDPNGEWMK